MTKASRVPFAYILRCADGTLYTGWTTDLERRVAEHNCGRGARYTRARRPVRLVYAESCADRGAAMRREAALKRLSRPDKLALIDGCAVGQSAR
jgi:putative endonuclease